MAKYKVISDFSNEQATVVKGQIIDAEPMQGEKMIMATIKGAKVVFPKEIVAIYQEVDNANLNKVKPAYLKFLPLVGIAGGLGYSYAKKLSPFAYIGWSLLGGLLFAVPLFIWSEKNEKLSMVGIPTTKENGIKKLYLLLKEMQNQKNKSEGRNDGIVSESDFNSQVATQGFSNDELVFLYQFNKGMLDMMSVPKENMASFYHNMSKQLSLIYEGKTINSAQSKFDKLNIFLSVK